MNIITGSPASGRRHADILGWLGCSSTRFRCVILWIRGKPSGNSGEVENTLAAFEDQDYPFEELVEKLAVPGTRVVIRYLM